MIALGWLNSNSSSLKTFVANRVSQTLELTRAKQWHHVSTTENPANVLSKGTMAQEFQNATDWWFGPIWLSNETAFWNKDSDMEQIPKEALLELRPVELSLVVVQRGNVLLDKYSKWENLVCATAGILKFIQFLKFKRGKAYVLRYLTTSDLKKAEHWFIRNALTIERETPKTTR